MDCAFRVTSFACKEKKHRSHLAVPITISTTQAMFGMHASFHSCTALADAFSVIYDNVIYADSMSSRRQ